MSDKDLDYLFKSKLDRHSTPPSPQSWDTLHQKLHPVSQKRIGYWHRIYHGSAAAVAILLVCSVLLSQWQQEKNIQLLAHKTESLGEKPSPSITSQLGNSTETAEKVVSKEGGVAQQSEETTIGTTENHPIAMTEAKPSATTESESPDSGTDRKTGRSIAKDTSYRIPEKGKNDIRTNRGKLPENPSTDGDRVASANTDNSEDMPIIEKAKVLLSTTEEGRNKNKNMPHIESESPSSIKIVYTLEPVIQEVPLPINDHLSVEEEQPKKERGLKRIVGLAKKLKNTELSIANLRSAKDELLAFDLSNKKKKKEN